GRPRRNRGNPRPLRRDRPRRRRDGIGRLRPPGAAGEAGAGDRALRHPARDGLLARGQPDHPPRLLRGPALRAAAPPR
ncbi:MAG: Sarcosine oxidase, partial [uncultured Thermomicrobiales bacterium]